MQSPNKSYWERLPQMKRMAPTFRQLLQQNLRYLQLLLRHRLTNKLEKEFETFRIPLVDFTRDDTELDLADLQFVSFFFGSNHGGGTGRVGLDQIEFVVR